MVIEVMKQTLEDLCNAMSNKEPMYVIIGAQQAFTTAVENAWKKFSEGKISVDFPTLPKIMYLFAVEELPLIISDEKLHDRIIKEIRLFRNTMDELIRPKED